MSELTPRAVCGLWPKPSLETLAADTGASLFAVRKWFLRDRLPSEWWTAIVAAAESRGLKDVTLEALAAMHARPASNADPRLPAEARA